MRVRKGEQVRAAAIGLLISLTACLPPVRAGAQPVSTLVTGATIADSLAALADLAGRTVRSVRFAGNTALNDDQLARNIYTEASSHRPFGRLEFFLPREFSRDRRRLEILHERHGFPQAEVRASAFLASGDVRVEFEIEEGPPLLVSGIDIVGWPLHSPSAAELLAALPLVAGKRYELEKADKSAATLVAKLVDRGYWQARATAEQAAADSTRVVLTVEPGRIYHLRAVGVEGIGQRGLGDIPRWMIDRDIELEPGVVFRPRAVEEARRRLQGLDVFQQIDVESRAVGSDSVDVRFGLGVRPKRSFAFGGGYSSEEKVRLRASWLNRSFLGYARRLAIEATYSSLLIGGRIRVAQRLIFRSKFDGEIELYQKLETENNYDLASRGGSVIATHPLAEHGTYSLGVEISRNDLTVKQVGGDIPDEGPSRLTEFKVRLTHDSSDIPLAPTRGTRAALNNRGSATAVNSDYSYIFSELFATHYRLLPRERIVALQMRAAVALPAGETAELPVWARHYGGGATTMRSYARRTLGPLDSEGNGLGGEAAFELGAELRFPLVGRLFGVFFGEAGQVWRKWDELRLDSLRPGVGTGLRIGTPVGPLRVDVGWKIGDFDSRLDPVVGHFAVGEAF